MQEIPRDFADRKRHIQLSGNRSSENARKVREGMTDFFTNKDGWKRGKPPEGAREQTQEEMAEEVIRREILDPLIEQYIAATEQAAQRKAGVAFLTPNNYPQMPEVAMGFGSVNVRLKERGDRSKTGTLLGPKQYKAATFGLSPAPTSIEEEKDTFVNTMFQVTQPRGEETIWAVTPKLYMAQGLQGEALPQKPVTPLERGGDPLVVRNPHGVIFSGARIIPGSDPDKRVVQLQEINIKDIPPEFRAQAWWCRYGIDQALQQ